MRNQVLKIICGGLLAGALSANSEQFPETVDLWDIAAPPVDAQFDWLQLTSGEWIKGDFRIMYNFRVEFDSDEMDLQEFDFKKVKQLRTRSMKTLLVEGDGGPRDTSVQRGVLVIKDDQVVLQKNGYEERIPRDRIVSIASGQLGEQEVWSGSLSIGINARGGNTETTDTSMLATLKRRTAKGRFNTNYRGNYSTAKNIETANNHRLNSYNDWFWTSRFYWKMLDAEIYNDPLKNIDVQYSVSSGFGFDFIRTPKSEWTINAGVGYQDMRFESVQPGEARSSNSPFFTTGTRLDHELTDDIDILYSYSMRWLNEENGQYTHHMTGTISFDLLGDLDLDFSAIWDHTEKPEQDSSGDLPEKDDYQLIVSLAYDF